VVVVVVEMVEWVLQLQLQSCMGVVKCFGVVKLGFGGGVDHFAFVLRDGGFFLIFFLLRCVSVVIETSILRKGYVLGELRERGPGWWFEVVFE